MRMQTPIRTLLVLTAVFGVVLSVGFNGIETIALMLPPAICVSVFVVLWRRHRPKSATVVLAAYLCLWLITAVFGPQSVRTSFERKMSSTGSENVSSQYNRHEDYALDRLAPRSTAPWHYITTRSTPCPLVVIADHGMMNPYNAGSGATEWIVWAGRPIGVLWRPSWWVRC
ncbi:hypothetical protein Q31a_51340 [Aureliella helgolandensis]|nr:hypothetical protein Q31a_51340 [Aureliella helgolandensis]